MCLLLMVLNIIEPNHSKTLELETRMYIMSKTYNAIRQYFAHMPIGQEIDIDSLYRKYLKKAIKTENRYEFFLLMNEFLAHLKNGHTGYSDRWVLEKYGGSLGFVLIYIDGKWVVFKSDIKNLSPGDVVIKINEKDFEEYFQEKKKYICASSERAARTYFTTKSFLFPQKFTIETEDGKIIKVKKRKKEKNHKVEGKWLFKNKIAYIKIHLFSGNFEKQAIEFVNKFKDAEAIIIDVRGNGGGSTPSQLVSILQTKPYKFWVESTPLHLASFESRKWLSKSYIVYEFSEKKSSDSAYRGKLVILTDRFCFSACEDFLMLMKQNGRAIIVGERTGGSTGQPYMCSFEDGIGIGIGSVRAHFLDGTLFEGVGIKPDYEVSYSIEDLRSGRDAFLEKALELVGH